MTEQKVIPPRRTFHAKYGKRWLDLVLTIFGLMVVSDKLGLTPINLCFYT